ncbi:MAG TPA: hypothetical protein VF944_07775 [Candidatus Bathyarchaeia archaeon]
MMFPNINTYIGVAVGVGVSMGLAWGYNVLVDNPSVVRETTAKVEAAAQARTLAAISEVTDASQKARAMRRLCRDTGKLYNFETGKCR